MANNTLTFVQTERGYEAEYSGDSGTLQMHRVDKGGLSFLGNAGLGYDLLESTDCASKRIMLFLNMTGLDSVKIISKTEVESCIVRVA